MTTPGKIVARMFGPGPEPLELLETLCAARSPGEEIAMLHSGDGVGHSVIGAGGMVTFEPGAGVDFLQRMQRDLDSVPLEPAAGDLPLVGWIGGISYDVGRELEHIPGQARDDMGWPLARWTLYREYYLLEHATGIWTLAIIDWADATPYVGSAARLDEMERFLGEHKGREHQSCGREGAFGAERGPETLLRGRGSDVLAAMTSVQYQEMVQRAKEFIAAGDIYQANLAQRWSVQTPMPAVHIYRRLAERSPAPFAAYLQWSDRAVISASPELFLQRDGARIETRPIKGTRGRSEDAAEDGRLRAELLASVKDRAELAMIVDLLRNDLGRVCAFGSVKVGEPRRIEGHPTVWHTLAHIQGRLTSEAMPWAEVLGAVCPGGSITGAPKIRAMQIIEELEPTRRGWYCGNLGWIGPGKLGGLRGGLNIAIRTILMRGRTAWVHAGGGIVADSDPASEYEETLIKARAMLWALSGDGVL